ncbi:MAG TPA: DUF456 domain-containing protein [Xanthomonadaceae bacterium]|nr:DUF456 domain-containing protein [Xanthomonadaceae bacterium]
MDPSFMYYLIAAVLVVVGIAGVLLPALPGLPLVFAGLLLAAWADDFQRVGWLPLLLIGLLTTLSFLIDFLASVYGAQRLGASAHALWGAAIGTVAGLFFLPLGLFLGPFVGAWLGEYWHSRGVGKATRVGLGTWLGILLGTASKLALGFCMLGLFAFAWFF